MASAIEFMDSNSLDINHHLHHLAQSSYSKLEELAGDLLSKFHSSVRENRSGFGRLDYPGTRPWPELPLGNHAHTDAAVVIIGGGISGKFNDLVDVETKVDVWMPGMCTAIRLLTHQRLKNFVIIEKSGGFGGTW